MSHKYTIDISRPLKRKYTTVGVFEGDDVTFKISFNHPDDQSWVNNGYNVTIYDKEDRTTLASVAIQDFDEEISIDDFSFDTEQALVVVEDRSDINNIETVETIGFIYFKKFPGGTTAITQEGFINVRDIDDSQIAIPYYSTGFQIV